MEQHFADWTDPVQQTVAYAAKLYHVERQRIGLVGLSLGGSLALMAAAQDDAKEHKIAAVVGLFGGLPEEHRKQINNLPPTLLIHGDLDECIPPRAAYSLESALLANKLPIELKMYQRVGHCFIPAKLMDVFDAGGRVDAFLLKHLKDGGAEKKDPGKP